MYYFRNFARKQLHRRQDFCGAITQLLSNILRYFSFARSWETLCTVSLGNCNSLLKEILKMFLQELWKTVEKRFADYQDFLDLSKDSLWGISQYSGNTVSSFAGSQNIEGTEGTPPLTMIRVSSAILLQCCVLRKYVCYVENTPHLQKEKEVMGADDVPHASSHYCDKRHWHVCRKTQWGIGSCSRERRDKNSHHQSALWGRESS